jgi:sugar phosphate isomerase/epimerase
MIYISTNQYAPQQLHQVFELIEKIKEPKLGIELFPEWHSPVFCDMVARYTENFRQYPSSLHGPYYYTEHSKGEGTEEYAKALHYFQQTLELSRSLHSSYIVYHHNNCRIEPERREEMVRNSARNLLMLRDEAQKFGARLAIENAGVLSRGNMLFDEAQFIRMAQEIPDAILLDVGHAHANGWDLKQVIKALAPKIIAYHVHNNDGHEDRHERILNGTLNFNRFLAYYREYTPQADIVIEYGKQCAQDTDGIIEDVAYINQALQKR